MLDLILSAQGVSKSCLRLSSLPPKYGFRVDSVGWEKNRSQHSLAPKLIFQDYRSGYKSKGEVNQFPQGKNSYSLRYHQEARPRSHLNLSSSWSTSRQRRGSTQNQLTAPACGTDGARGRASPTCGYRDRGSGSCGAALPSPSTSPGEEAGDVLTGTGLGHTSVGRGTAGPCFAQAWTRGTLGFSQHSVCRKT